MLRACVGRVIFSSILDAQASEGDEKGLTRARRTLEAANPAGLLIDVTKALSLLAFLQQAGGCHDQQDIDAHHTEDSSKDIVDEDVRKRGNRRGTAAHEGCGGRAGAGRIRHESR